VQSGSEPEAASSGRRNEPVGVSVLRGGTPSLIPDIAGVKERLRIWINLEGEGVHELNMNDLTEALRVIEGLEVSIQSKENTIQYLSGVNNDLRFARDKTAADLTEAQARCERLKRRSVNAEETVLDQFHTIERLTAALEKVRAAILEHAPDTLWVGLIETAVDCIDAALTQGRDG
jgi:hypothetical protein